MRLSMTFIYPNLRKTRYVLESEVGIGSVCDKTWVDSGTPLKSNPGGAVVAIRL